MTRDPITPMNRLDGRLALVTGAWRGIGRATATTLLRLGARVAVNVRDPARAGQLAAELGEGAVPAPADMGSPGEIERMVDRVSREQGRIDILVNNAAFASGSRLPALTEAEWRRAFDVNVTAPFLLLQAVRPAMEAARHGRIINVSSTAGKTVSTLGGAHYTASKHALLGLTRAAARELGPHGITVNAVCPGMTDTRMIAETAAPETIREIVETRVPIRRLGRPDEVAGLIGFLASDESGFINGAAIDINGGIVLV